MPRFVLNRPHSPGEFVSGESYLTDIVEENREKEIARQLATFLAERFGTPTTNSIHTQKAKAILEGHDPIPNIPPDLSDYRGKNILREAIKKGAVRDFHIQEAWNSEAFINGDLDTYPTHHDIALLYHGAPRAIFYPTEPDVPEEYKSDFLKLGSVLKNGFISSDNLRQIARDEFKHQYIEQLIEKEELSPREAEQRWKEHLNSTDSLLKREEFDEKFDTKKNGVYFGNLELANYFRRKNEGIIIEARIPVDELWMVYGATSNIEKKRVKAEKIPEIFDSPEHFRNWLRGRGEEVQFGIWRELPLEWITGVWDELNESCQPRQRSPSMPTLGSEQKFIPLAQYVAWLKENRIWQMDRLSFPKKGLERVENEIEKLNNIEDYLRKMLYYIERMMFCLSYVRENKQRYGDVEKYAIPKLSYLKDKYTMQNGLVLLISGEKVDKDVYLPKEVRSPRGPGYSRVYARLREYVEEELRSKASPNNSISLLGDLEELEGEIEAISGYIENLLDDIEDIKEEEKQRAESSKWVRGDIEAEREFEEKVNQRVVNNLSGIPLLKPLLPEIREDQEYNRETISHLKDTIETHYHT